MPKLSVWYVRASLFYLGLASTFGALLLSHKGIPWAPWTWKLLVSHMDVALFGWVTLLAMGVAYWILPRFGVRRGREAWARAALLSMNGGLLLLIVAPWVPSTPVLVLVGRLFEVLAVFAFVVHAWPRVKPLMVSSADLEALKKKTARSV